MAENSLIVDFLTGKDEVTEQMNQLVGKVEQLGNLSNRGLINTEHTNQQIDGLKEQFPNLSSAIDDAFSRGTASAGKFDMRLLSLTFSGMALQSAFGGMFRAIKDTFFAAEGDTSALTESTNQLTAAWEFFKFSLFDALNTPFFVKIIDGVTGIIDDFSKMSDTTKQVILGVIVGLTAIGTSLFLLGQIKLGWDAMFATGGFFNSKEKIDTGISGTKSKLTNLAGTAFGIYLIYQGIQDLKEGDIIGGIVDLVPAAIALSGKPGVAIPLWLVFKGIELGVPKLMDSINEFKSISNFFDANFLQFSLAKIAPESLIGRATGADDLAKQMEYLDTSTKKVINSQGEMGLAINDNLNPAVEANNNLINDSNTIYTEDFVTATDKRIDKIDEETAALKRRNEERINELNGLSNTVIERYSSVTAE